ncbi:hypothetical protein J6590_031032 [Homalodisca vitripennis]|nr:hypothetical protein J6590_031032 [Homalodisca vitripennis]
MRLRPQELKAKMSFQSFGRMVKRHLLPRLNRPRSVSGAAPALHQPHLSGYCPSGYGQEECLLSSAGGTLVGLGLQQLALHSSSSILIQRNALHMMSDQMPHTFPFYKPFNTSIPSREDLWEQINLFHQRSSNSLQTALK